MQKIQTSIRGFAGSPVSLFSLFDPETTRITVAKESALRERLDADTAHVTNSIDVDDRDALFTDEHFQAAIQEYLDMKTADLLKINDAVMRCNPTGAIEMDSVKEKGRVYRVATAITNSQVAALATVWYARRNKAAAQACDMMDDIMRLMNGEAVTI